MPVPPSLHGGPDAQGVPLWDFSTNANACGPCPQALAAVQQADATRYPDPAYTELRAQLAAFHGVEAARIVLAGSASEFIHRITALATQRGVRAVAVPAHGYGDYTQAARARGLAVHPAPLATAGLHWACEPSSPLGQADAALAAWQAAGAPAQVLRVLDCAYQPLRLHAHPAPPPTCWQLWTPNKALGLTGVRAAYAIATQGGDADAADLAALAPSWPVGAHGVALLQAWVQPATQQWLAACLPRLRDWKDRQIALCAALGWQVLPGSQANYFCARPPVAALPDLLRDLRAQGIKLRDCASFGLPGVVRMGVLAPEAQDALCQAWARQPTKEFA
ncbi:MAG: aminotransferase class I/II-fold pyridoxal phosphate-dependent enzyme [Simplicispira sp.]|nr:aminotransferase class I/II-fold pyridoxal phosphate-dependent enzyme [Simplicispira sp.]